MLFLSIQILFSNHLKFLRRKSQLPLRIYKRVNPNEKLNCVKLCNSLHRQDATSSTLLSTCEQDLRYWSLKSQHIQTQRMGTVFLK